MGPGPRWVWLVAALCAVLQIGMPLAQTVIRMPGDFSLENVYPNVVFGLLLPALGALVLSRLGPHPIGWLFVGCGLASTLTLAVYAYADYWLSGPPGITVSEQGYYSPTTNIKNVMPADKYAFWYEGKPWKGAPERGIKEGDLRDGGSLETRAANVAYWHQWPDEYDHLIQKWDEFLSA